jgi:glycosyltransferase involved in cell wall biosynthesis
MTKILHIITRLDMGGSAQNTLLTCKELSGKYEIILVHGLSLESGMTELEKQMVEDGVEKAKNKAVKLIVLPSLVRSIRPIKDFKALLALVWLIFKEKPDAVHTHSSKAGLLGRLAAKITFRPNIIHTPHGHVFNGHFGAFASRIFLWVEKLFARFTDRIVALTDGEKDDYLEMSVCAPDKLLTIHSGVDVQQFLHAMETGPKKSVPSGWSQMMRLSGLLAGCCRSKVPITC